RPQHAAQQGAGGIFGVRRAQPCGPHGRGPAAWSGSAHVGPAPAPSWELDHVPAWLPHRQDVRLGRPEPPARAPGAAVLAGSAVTRDSDAAFCAGPAMSALLGLGSSVLRQAQACQSFRRRTEEEPGCAPADPPAKEAWRPGGAEEFFAHLRRVLRKGEGRQGLPRAQVLLRSRAPAPAEPVDPARGLGALTPEEVVGLASGGPPRGARTRSGGEERAGSAGLQVRRPPKADAGPVAGAQRGRPQVEMLYEEALYTVLHRAGATGPEQVDDQEALLEYLRQVSCPAGELPGLPLRGRDPTPLPCHLPVFGASPEEHAAVRQRVQESEVRPGPRTTRGSGGPQHPCLQAPTYALKVSVMRAKNLLAKDPNGERPCPWPTQGLVAKASAECPLCPGSSDPYCVLGILPATGALREEARPPQQRFGLPRGTRRGPPLPAKGVQATAVKSSTLNPVWKEHFLFEIEDVHSDQLQLDVWYRPALGSGLGRGRVGQAPDALPCRDHDEDVSLVEACRRLGQVAGLKGVGRYFKQVVKAARTKGPAGPGEDHAGDFLGRLDIPVREVPVAGVDRWFKLQPRSSASRVQGDCQLVLKLITTQVGSLSAPSPAPLTMHPSHAPQFRTQSRTPLHTPYHAPRPAPQPCTPPRLHLTSGLGRADCGPTFQRDSAMSRHGRPSFLPYLQLLDRLLQFEHLAEEPNSSSWRGELSGPGATVLCLLGAQSDLSALQLAVLHWQASSRHHQTRTLDYSYLLGLLEDMQAHWAEASSLPPEQEDSLADSFSAFSEFGLGLLRQLRHYFPATNSAALYRLELLLKWRHGVWAAGGAGRDSPRQRVALPRCLGKLQLFQPSSEVCPFQRELNMDIAAALKRGNREWYEGLLNAESPREQPGTQRLAGLVALADAVFDDLRSCHSVYAGLFHSVKIDIFALTFRQLEHLVAEEAWGLAGELSPKLNLQTASALSELYLTLADIQRLWGCIPGRDSRALALGGVHESFLPAVKLWLQALRDQAKWRLQGAVDVDTLEPTEATSKHSSSAATASLCIGHVQELWVRLAWPDPAQAQELGTLLSQDLGEVALFYTELLRKKVDTQPRATSETASEQLCVLLNNVALVRKAAGQALRGLAPQERAPGPQGLLPRALLGWAQALEEDLQREASTVTAHLTSQMAGDIGKYVQHVSLSPDSIQSEEAAAPLLKFLDTKLAVLSASLEEESLSRCGRGRGRGRGHGRGWALMGMPRRVLEALWELLLQAILQALGAHRDVSADFYSRFQFTLEALVCFFHAEGRGLPLDGLKGGSYKRLEEELRLHRCSVREGIEQYYLDKLKQVAAACPGRAGWRASPGRPHLPQPLGQSRFGRLSVRCHYEVAEQRLVVEVLHAADLPPLDANGLSDPFVIVELGPPHLFPLVRSQRTQVKSRTLHPVFEELFHFSVPAEACRRRGACVLFTVMDHDWLSTNDFAGEAALGLGSVCGVTRHPAGGGARALQPVTLPLRRPRAQVKSALRMLEGRPDKEAQEFVKRLKELEKCMEADP
ncbi:LOW QUALITY PROTEIN: BAI1-associated protein 3, partial [Galemys pyrenaicus]